MGAFAKYLLQWGRGCEATERSVSHGRGSKRAPASMRPWLLSHGMEGDAGDAPAPWMGFNEAVASQPRNEFFSRTQVTFWRNASMRPWLLSHGMLVEISTDHIANVMLQ